MPSKPEKSKDPRLVIRLIKAKENLIRVKLSMPFRKASKRKDVKLRGYSDSDDYGDESDEDNGEYISMIV